MDIWALLGNPEGNLHINDSIFFEETSMNFAKQGKCFDWKVTGAKTPHHAGRATRDEWDRRAHYGEVGKGYTHGDYFPDAMVRLRQSHHGMSVRERRNDAFSPVSRAGFDMVLRCNN